MRHNSLKILPQLATDNDKLTLPNLDELAKSQISPPLVGGDKGEGM